MSKTLINEQLARSEGEIDAMSNDGRLTALAMRLAIDAGADWPSLDGEAQDAWHERAIENLRKGSTRKTLTVEQLAALRTFADANGRTWKAALNTAWSTGRYSDYNGTDEYGALQQVRNTFGPSWLVKFSLVNTKTHSRSF